MKRVNAKITILLAGLLTACLGANSSGPSSIPTSAPAGSGTESEVCVPKFVELINNAIIQPYENEPGIERLGSADFDGDRFPDILVTRIVFATDHDSPVDILLNDGKGRFSRATDELFPDGQPTVQHPTSIQFADFNNDGKTDAFIADLGMDKSPWPGNENTFLLSQPDGTYRDAADHIPSQADETHSAAVGDIDRDGDEDLYVGNLGGGGVAPYVLLNDGEGHFSKDPTALPEDVSNLDRNWNTASLLADINNDAYPDLILGQGDAGKFSHVYLNDQNGGFNSSSFELPVSALGENESALDISPFDFNNDGWTDLLMIYTTNDYTAKYMQILINQGGQSFEDQTAQRISQTTNGNWIRFARSADFNHDGAMDFMVGVIGEKSRLYLNDGEGHFTQTNFGFDLFDFTAGDFDQDGWPDLLSSGSAYEGSVEFHATFLNQGCP